MDTRERYACSRSKKINHVNFTIPAKFWLFMFKLFDAMVKPILCYAAEIWGYAFSEQIESIQAGFCKRFLGLSRNANNCMALGECGRYLMCTTYYTKCIKYWCHLLCMNDNRYPKNCYRMLKSHAEIGRSNWASNIRDLLYRFEFGFVWLSQDVGNVSAFIQQFRQRVIDCSIQSWHSDIDFASKYEHYKNFKTLLNVERYVSGNLPFYIRKSVAKFRCSNHLNIGVGRHANIQREFRTCSFCILKDNIYSIEDEFHAFLNASYMMTFDNAIYQKSFILIDRCLNSTVFRHIKTQILSSKCLLLFFLSIEKGIRSKCNYFDLSAILCMIWDILLILLWAGGLYH